MSTHARSARDVYSAHPGGQARKGLIVREDDGDMSDELRGYLLIADISGYTTFLNESELQHAQGTLTDLLELLIDQTRPPLVISRLEGDAVISYCLDGEFLTAQTFVESIENTYVAFRRAIELMVLNNTCRCNACANVSSLDLKFFVHHGSFVVQRLGDHDELMGRDVNLAFRLLKNSVVEKLGISAYCLYTATAVRELGMEDFGGLLSHTESVSDFGQVQLWVSDMHRVYEARREDTQMILDDDDVLFEVETEIEMSPEEVWDYLSRPEFRSTLIGDDGQEITDRQEGRIGPGSAFQCYHGKEILPQVILEWHPFERVVTRDQFGKPFAGNTLIADYRLEATDSGTRLRRLIGGLSGKRYVARIIRWAAPKLQQKMQSCADEFRQRIEEDHRLRTTAEHQAPDFTSEEVAAAAAASFQQT